MLKFEPIGFQQACALNVAIKTAISDFVIFEIGKIIKYYCILKLPKTILSFPVTGIFVKEQLSMDMSTKFLVSMLKNS